mgnify:CR=1 FL=1
MEISRETLIHRLIDIQYERNDIAFERNRFRVRGDTVEIWPVYSDEDVVRIEFFGDEVDRISRINPLTGVVLGELGHTAIFPASHYVTQKINCRLLFRIWRRNWSSVFSTSSRTAS